MKKVGGLWPELTSFGNLLAAAEAAARGKRQRPDVARFLLELEPELAAMRRELLEGSYTPGAYREFRVLDPKPRNISAAPFRDRVVHHALTQILEPVFERRFTGSSYACRKGLGTHKALEKARRAAHNYPYVLKCDIRQYFPSIDHEILKGMLGRVIVCGPTLELAGRIIDGSNRQAEATAYFPGDDLFTPYERRRGIPLGNQTSQFFANVYLNPLDHFVHEELRPACYLRYVDDFLLFAAERSALEAMKERIAEFLSGLRLRLHAGKSRVSRTAEGVRCLGWRLFPNRLRLDRGNLARFRGKLKALQRHYAAGEMEWREVAERVGAWNAHAAHGDTFRLREELFSRYNFGQRRTAVKAAGR